MTIAIDLLLHCCLGSLAALALSLSTLTILSALFSKVGISYRRGADFCILTISLLSACFGVVALHLWQDGLL